MKRTVTVTIEVDPTEYHDVEDTDEGAVELVKMMLRADADLPDKAEIRCGNAKIDNIWNS